jgi:hypothetical protein
MLILLIIVALIVATLKNTSAWNYFNFTHLNKKLFFSEYLSDSSSILIKIEITGIPFFVLVKQNTPIKKLRNAINKQTIGIYAMFVTDI